MLTWQRGDGWPRGAARLLTWTGALWALGGWALGAASGMLALALLTLALGLTLSLWRRGVSLHRQEGTLTRWYGLAWGRGAWPLRHLESCSLTGFTLVSVESRPEHYKRWPEMWAVVLRREGALERLVVDDEYREVGSARAQAEQVAEFLDFALVGPGPTYGPGQNPLREF